MLQYNQFIRLQQALEYRVLHTLTVFLALLGYLMQSSLSIIILCIMGL